MLLILIFQLQLLILRLWDPQGGAGQYSKLIEHFSEPLMLVWDPKYRSINCKGYF